MRLKSSIEYSIIFLRSLNKDKPTKLENIAIEYDISHHFLEQLAAKFRRKGIVKSKKGAGGGYLINVNKVGLNDIIEITDRRKARSRVTDKKSTSTILKMFESIATNKLKEINILN